MFDSLQEKLTKTLRNVQGKGKLSERNMEETLREIRVALLESDVNYNVVKNFLEKIEFILSLCFIFLNQSLKVKSKNIFFKINIFY